MSMVDDLVTDDDLDKIFDEIDDLFTAGLFLSVDVKLLNLDVAQHPVDILVCYLAVTLCAHNKLPSRPGFFKRVKAHFESIGRMEPGLLSGLEGG